MAAYDTRLFHRLAGVLVTASLVIAASSTARAESTRATTAAAAAEAEHVVPAQGGAYDVPLHAGAVCILSFPDEMAMKALTTSAEYDVRAWGDDGVAVRALKDSSKPATLALATASGSVKVNVTLRVVPAAQPALTLIRFKAEATERAAAERLDAAVARRTAELGAEVQRLEAAVDTRARARAGERIAAQLLERHAEVALGAHARNDDHVIVHVRGGVLLGDDGYVLFELENRSGAPYRLATIEVRADGKRISGAAALTASSAAPEAGVIGVVAAGARRAGVVAIPEVDRVLGDKLRLTIAGPDGKGAIVVSSGLVLR
jgi:hypothetical protein